MSAEIIRLRPRMVRAWRLTEIKPGLWRAELHEFGKGIVWKSAAASLEAIRARVSGDGLQIWEKYYSGGPAPRGGGDAA